ncbi:hypothetical protein RJ639_033578 [Escallonia herrerae]|uniref:Uncharacterized protein n=1 Tax=Escallonia herrerae TaxID=1293975 RepID=A0AA88WUX4_9ASTE|nr:hypothetical protein RJ639_033578 [Escallonia herrerae]
MTLEGCYLRDGIQNIVATEGEERISRSVRINVWRAFFARFGMVEIELGNSSLYQANLILKQFSCGGSCTLESNGKSLIIGWKSTPVHSLSIWKFTKLTDIVDPDVFRSRRHSRDYHFILALCCISNEIDRGLLRIVSSGTKALQQAITDHTLLLVT